MIKLIKLNFLKIHGIFTKLLPQEIHVFAISRLYYDKTIRRFVTTIVKCSFP